MKREIISLVVFSSLSMMNYAHANEGCAIRRAEIEQELHLAQQYSNVSKIAGLKEALGGLNAHCSHESIYQRTQHEIRKLHNKIVEKNEEIQELTNDLSHVKAEGNSDKEAKIRHKLDKKQGELLEAQQKLDAALREKNP
ncbi:MAG: DUF1090 domain-containing protein [Pantoea dispersa]|jgi:uncharacterized coiled-coil DUF342 family protein|nr:DUF1090 family protein [Pantoea dispersa]MBZ6392514.1 DUF1090 domain-containing protein [Pantoea dispersa]